MNCPRLILALFFAFGCVSLAAAAPTAEQRKQIRDLETAVQKAGNLYTQGKYKECGQVLTEVQAQFDELAAGGDSEVIGLLQGVYPRLLKAHALLELEGVRLPPLTKPGMAPSTPSGSTPGSGGVSFVKSVAPMLVAKCGGCHVRDRKGQFSMATFDDLMKGPPAGVVIFPGDAVGSRLVEVIETGDMPRGGGKVSPQEFEQLKQWIAAGAPFDGANRTMNLASLAGGAPAPEPMKVEVAAATGKEKISFSRDIAPVLVQECATCHGYGQQPGGDLNMTTFTGLLTGGDSGSPIVPGKAAESLIIRKLKGEAGDRMPLRRPPLSDAVIAQFATWIAEGARFDGPDPATDVRRVADLYRATHATHDQLSAERAKIAEQNWRLGMPNIAMEKAETTNFLLVGNVGENTLADIGQKAEAMAPEVAKIFKAPADAPLVKGRVTLFVFAQRYDYSEFGQMAEKRELPPEWRGHARFDTLDAYGAVVVPRGDEYSLEGLIAQQVAGVYAASLGDSPAWFREGAARVAASRITPEDPRVVAWNENVKAAVGLMTQPADFLQGKLPAEPTAVASYSFVKFLMSDSRRFDALLGQIQRGTKFPQAFQQVYGAPPEQLTAAWVRRAPK